MKVWKRVNVERGSMEMWKCGSVQVCQCGIVEVWKRGTVDM